MIDLAQFFTKLSEQTGVSFPLPTNQSMGAGATHPVVLDSMIAGKDNVGGISDQRTYDRMYKQKTSVPSLYLQAMNASKGDSLLAQSRTGSNGIQKN